MAKPFFTMILFDFSFQAEKNTHEVKRQEFMDRNQKVSADLDRITAEYTMTFNELNELKKKHSTTQNEQASLQRRISDLVRRINGIA